MLCQVTSSAADRGAVCKERHCKERLQGTAPTLALLNVLLLAWAFLTHTLAMQKDRRLKLLSLPCQCRHWTSTRRCAYCCAEALGAETGPASLMQRRSCRNGGFGLSPHHRIYAMHASRLQVSKFTRNAATNFAPRASGSTGKNPAYPGVRAVIMLVSAGGAYEDLLRCELPAAARSAAQRLEIACCGAALHAELAGGQRGASRGPAGDQRSAHSAILRRWLRSVLRDRPPTCRQHAVPGVRVPGVHLHCGAAPPPPAA